MNTMTPRPSLTGIAAACILSGGLITAAIIDSHKPVAIIGGNRSPLVATTVAAAPPYSQADVEKQVEAQFLASPKLRGMPYKGSTCDLTGVHTTLIEYSAKEDQFFVTFDLQWTAQPMTTEKDSSGVTTHAWGGEASTPPNTGVITLSNDGYGHYHGSFDPGPNEPNMPWVDLTVR